MSASDCIEPGATLGVFGGGQLGRMFAMAAARMGYRVVVFAPESNGPAAQIAHQHIQAQYDDQAKLEQFARGCDAVTLEFENVPVEALETIQQWTRPRPDATALATAQDRLHERDFLDRHGLPAAPHESAHNAADVARATETLATPFVLKASRFGYDGRGQCMVHSSNEAEQAWREVGADAALCEQWVDFQYEISVLVARSPRGEVTTFGPIHNEHANHILDCSTVPADVPAAVSERAVEVARQVAEVLHLEGLICVEMFVDQADTVLVNELAPRPHNSGHLTIEACLTSQFEQQVRAMCNLPLGSMEQRAPAAMANLLGDLWQQQPPAWSRILDQPGLYLHLYGKDKARPGRKMGHLTALDSTAQVAAQRARAARERLLNPTVATSTDRSPSAR